MFAFCPRDGTPLVPTRIDGRERPACPVCGFAEFMHVQIGANTIVERDGEARDRPEVLPPDDLHPAISHYGRMEKRDAVPNPRSSAETAPATAPIPRLRQLD